MNNETPTQKMWLTKYVFTSGLAEVDAQLVDLVASRGETVPSYARVGTFGFYRIGKDIHYTLEEALAVCEKKRTAKIKSLQKTLKKIENLDFRGSVDLSTEIHPAS